jgi:hypothetical protein
MAASGWKNALQAFSFDVIEEGAENVASGARLAGCNTIVLMVSENEIAPVKVFHNPHRSDNWGEAYFRPTPGRYPAALIPSVSGQPQSDGDVAFPALRKAAAEVGVQVVPWMQIMRTPEGAGERNRTRDLNGEIVGEWLCPNGPDTLDFAGALCLDCAERFEAPAVYIDRIRFPSLGHNGKGAIAEALTCFCDGCFERARQEGVDLEGARRVLVEWIKVLDREPRAAGELARELAGAAIRGFRGASEQSKVIDLLRFRHRTIERLIARCRESVPSGVELWLDTWQPTEGWLLGQDLKTLSKYATWVKPFFYHQIVTWTMPDVIRSLSADAAVQQIWYEAYLKFLGYEGPSDFPTFAEHGLSPKSITTEMLQAKSQLGGRAKLAAGVGIWVCGPDGVRVALEHAAKAEPNGVWMHCYSWATMDELAAAGDWLREHGKDAAPYSREALAR